MKKFLGKLPVMITLVALTVVMAVVYIGMLVRPVAIGMTYKGEVNGAEVSVKIKNSSQLVMTIDGEEMKSRYLEHDRKIAVFFEEMSDKEYEELKEDLIKNWDDLEEAGMVVDVNAFSVEMEGEEFTCAGSIVFAVVGGVVLVALATFGTLSVLYYVKGRKK